MKAFYSSLLAAATIVSSAGSSAPAFAQQTAAPAAAPAGETCEIDQGRPQPVARAMLSLTRAQAAMKSGDPTKDLKDIISALTAPNLKNENPIGRSFMLASAYVLLLEQPNIQAVMPRSAVGIATDPASNIDLFAAADSAITVVEQSSPSCAKYMAPFRQQKAWLNVTNAAINALNANKLDSAEIYAKRSLTLDRKSPYPYTVLASVSKAKKNFPEMMEYSKQVIATSGDDTTYTDVKERAQYELASTGTDAAMAAKGADRQRLAREAIKSWGAIITSQDGIQSTVAINNLQKLYIAAGDSLKMATLYAPLIADPTKYSEGALLQAGVVASQFKRPDDAALLFEGVAAKNPYSRDALNNLAASYLQAGETAKVAPIIHRLVALDPNNPDNLMLYAFLYVGKLKTTKDVKLTKAYNDSLVTWNTKAEKMAMKVSFKEFSRNGEGTTLVGEIENRGTTARTYSTTFEFLGKNGEVLFSEPMSVGPVAPKATKEFTIKNSKKEVVGYRYKPLP